MKSIEITIPTSQTDIITKIFDYKSHEKVFNGKDIIREVKNVHLNGVKVNGDSLQVLGNVIYVGFYEKRNVVEKDKKVGILYDFKEKTAELWNTRDFKTLVFTRNDIKYYITFEYDF